MQFDVFGCRKILLYPTGCSGQNGESISIYLELVGAKGFDCRKRVHGKYSISVKDQISGAHRKMTGTSSCSFIYWTVFWFPHLQVTCRFKYPIIQTSGLSSTCQIVIFMFSTSEASSFAKPVSVHSREDPGGGIWIYVNPYIPRPCIVMLYLYKTT